MTSAVEGVRFRPCRGPELAVELWYLLMTRSSRQRSRLAPWHYRYTCHRARPAFPRRRHAVGRHGGSRRRRVVRRLVRWIQFERQQRRIVGRHVRGQRADQPIGSPSRRHPGQRHRRLARLGPGQRRHDRHYRRQRVLSVGLWRRDSRRRRILRGILRRLLRRVRPVVRLVPDVRAGLVRRRIGLHRGAQAESHAERRERLRRRLLRRHRRRLRRRVPEASSRPRTAPYRDARAGTRASRRGRDDSGRLHDYLSRSAAEQ